MSYASPEFKLFWALVNECLPVNTPKFTVFLGKWYHRWWACLLLHMGLPLVLGTLIYAIAPIGWAIVISGLSILLSAAVFMGNAVSPIVQLQMFGGHLMMKQPTTLSSRAGIRCLDSQEKLPLGAL